MSIPLLQLEPVPGIAAGLSGPRYGIKPPGLFARAGIERRDEIAAFSAPADALHHLALRYQRAACNIETRGVVGDHVIPNHAAGLDIQRHHVRVGSWNEEAV